MNRPLTIIGGGLAGLSLGIALRDALVPVTVVEAGQYPRHRVCGEFINGRGQAALSRLVTEARLAEAGMIPLKTARFYCGRRQSGILDLPKTAWSISRYALDALLADALKEGGGGLVTGRRWSGNFASEGFVRATGRRLCPTVQEDRWFGLKAHAEEVTLSADLELHFTRSGYVGLSRLGGGRVNICGLFRGQSNRSDDVFGLLTGEAKSTLKDRLSHAVWLGDSRCSTAGLFFGRSEDSSLECVIGDAFAMIAPLTGNGMSMAVESAMLALEPLCDYSRGLLDWSDARLRIGQRCAEQFRPRLVWGRWLQLGLLRLWLAPIALLAMGHGGWLWRTAFDRTR